MKEIIEKYFDRLWPINRSLTGNGNRESLKILSELVDLQITEVPSGTKCFDWTVPPEWNVNEAWIKDSRGNEIVNFRNNNLHLLGYSEGVKGKFELSELKKHLHTLSDQPDVIPYLTSYYSPRWGFCMSHKEYEKLKDDTYDVMIDAIKNENGSMTYGEAFIKGNSENEVLLSTYICHPSMASNELSGPLVTAQIYNELKKKRGLNNSYRFLFLPETIGSIYYLSVNGKNLKEKLIAGYVVTCVGDSGMYTYKRSREGSTLADRAAELVLNQSQEKFQTENFFPTGSDERQYCSPGFNLPVGSLMRTRYGKYKEYHTSADNKDYVSFEAMEKTAGMYLKIISVIENNFIYVNNISFCEPNLGKRDLYPTLGSQKETSDLISAMMWVLNLSDGTNDMIEISNRSGISFELLVDAAAKLNEKGILEERKI